MWIYGTHASPQLNAALGERIQAVPTPKAGAKACMLANPEGNFITTSCKEKEAAWEFLMFTERRRPGDLARAAARSAAGAHVGLDQRPALQDNRFFKLAAAQSATWWRPPYEHKNWANYQDKIAPVLAAGAAPGDLGEGLPRAGGEIPARRAVNLRVAELRSGRDEKSAQRLSPLAGRGESAPCDGMVAWARRPWSEMGKPSVEDRLAIEDFFVRYTTSLDRGDVSRRPGLR